MSLDVVAAMNTRVGITAHHTSQDRYQGDCKFFYSVANDLGSQAVSTPVIFPSLFLLLNSHYHNSMCQWQLPSRNTNCANTLCSPVP